MVDSTAGVRGRLGAVCCRCEHIREAAGLGRHQVAVGVEENLRSCPSTLVLDPLERRSSGHVKARPSVPETMRRQVPVRPQSLSDELPKDSFPEVRGPDESPHLSREDQGPFRYREDIGLSVSKRLHQRH